MIGQVSQGRMSCENYGRDHHPRCFTIWMAGGGIKGGTIHGATDDLSYNIVENAVHLRDFHATILHLLGFDHQRFTVRHQGLDQRLTGVEPARVIQELLAGTQPSAPGRWIGHGRRDRARFAFHPLTRGTPGD